MGIRRYGCIPAHEKLDVTDELMALLGLVENLQRDDLFPLDAALGLLRFQEEHQLSTDALAKRTGLDADDWGPRFAPYRLRDPPE